MGRLVAEGDSPFDRIAQDQPERSIGLDRKRSLVGRGAVAVNPEGLPRAERLGIRLQYLTPRPLLQAVNLVMVMRGGALEELFEGRGRGAGDGKADQAKPVGRPLHLFGNDLAPNGERHRRQRMDEVARVGREASEPGERGIRSMWRIPDLPAGERLHIDSLVFGELRLRHRQRVSRHDIDRLVNEQHRGAVHLRRHLQPDGVPSGTQRHSLRPHRGC